MLSALITSASVPMPASEIAAVAEVYGDDPDAEDDCRDEVS
jgi:hypothetical protein